MEGKKIKSILKDAGIYSGGPKIVAIGGGTGLSVLLRGIKRYTSNITAIVTVADDGGGSGLLREDLGILPPGDIRNCIMALANTEPIMEKLMQYRFKEGSLRGQSFGNLFIAALNDICGSFDGAIKEISNVLAVTGKVIPATLENVVLFAELEDGTIVKGESQIPIKQQVLNKKIKRIFLKPHNCKPIADAIKAIKEADAIILGPGSLYTSIIPNLLIKDIAKAVKKSDALKIYVSNIMTQQGETVGYSLYEHIKALNEHAGANIIQYAIANTGNIPGYLLQKYRFEGAAPVEIDADKLKEAGIKLIKGNFVTLQNEYIRHDFNFLSEHIFKLIIDEKLAGDKKRLIEYYYINDKLKKNSRFRKPFMIFR